jgi:hypothetical protein
MGTRLQVLAVVGLRSLSPIPAASGGAVSTEVPLPAGVAMLAPCMFWVDSLCSCEDDDDEELAPWTPSASTNGVVPGSVCDVVDVRHGGKALEEPPMQSTFRG